MQPVDADRPLGGRMLEDCRAIVLQVRRQLDAHRVLAEGAVDKDEAAAVRSGEGVARVAAKTPVKPGDKLTFAVDIDEMKFFDTKTGLSIRG